MGDIRKDVKQAKRRKARQPRHSKAGTRITASLKEAVAWAEGKHVPVRVTAAVVSPVRLPAQARQALSEDAADLAAFEERAREPNFDFKRVLKDLTRRR